MLYIHFPAPSDPGRWPGPPRRSGQSPGFRVENTDSGEKHSRPDHHMLMPRLFIHLPRRRLKNGDQTRMIVSDLKKCPNPPGGKRGGSPCAPVHMTRIMPDQHPSGPGTGAGDRRGAPPIHAPGPGAQGAGRRETILSGNRHTQTLAGPRSGARLLLPAVDALLHLASPVPSHLLAAVHLSIGQLVDGLDL